MAKRAPTDPKVSERAIKVALAIRQAEVDFRHIHLAAGVELSSERVAEFLREMAEQFSSAVAHHNIAEAAGVMAEVGDDFTSDD